MVDPPGSQLYVPPPDAVSVALCPLQTVAVVPLMIVTVGVALTVTANVDVFEHPFVPVTV